MREVVFVAGVGRAGLGLVMQFIHAGGFPVAGDFPSYSVGDGRYLEGRYVANWIGRAVKIVDPVQTQPSFRPGAIPLRVVYVTRDPQQQALSALRYARRRLPGAILDASDPRKLAALAKGIERDASRGRRLLEQYARPGNVLGVTFEDACSQPLAVAHALRDFLRLPTFDVRAATAQLRPRRPGLLPIDLEPRLRAFGRLRRIEEAFMG